MNGRISLIAATHLGRRQAAVTICVSVVLVFEYLSERCQRQLWCSVKIQ